MIGQNLRKKFDQVNYRTFFQLILCEQTIETWGFFPWRSVMIDRRRKSTVGLYAINTIKN